MIMRDGDRLFLTRFSVELVFSALVIVAGLVILAGGATLGWRWTEAGPPSGYAPFYLGLILVLAGLGLAASTITARKAMRSATFLTRSGAREVLALFGPIAGLVIGAQVLGIYVAGLLYLFATIRFQARTSTLRAAAIAIASVALFFVMFEVWFRIPLAKGPVESYLGL